MVSSVTVVGFGELDEAGLPSDEVVSVQLVVDVVVVVSVHVVVAVEMDTDRLGWFGESVQPCIDISSVPVASCGKSLTFCAETTPKAMRLRKMNFMFCS